MTESRPEGVTGKITRSSAAYRMAPGMLADLSEVGRNLARSLFDPSRPELHYMRGPGPREARPGFTAYHATRALAIERDLT
jgi:hypothetical protein